MTNINKKWVYHVFEKESGVLSRLTVGNIPKKREIRHHGLQEPNELYTYMELRFFTEKILYERFVNKGGNPQTKAPFYFSLDFPVDVHTYHNPIIFRYKLESIPSEIVSFCLGDSLSISLPQKRSKLVKSLYRKEEMDYILKCYGDSFLNPSNCKYIEMQLWSEKYMLEMFRNAEIVNR